MGLLADTIAEVKTWCEAHVTLGVAGTGQQNFWTSIQGAKKSIVEQLREQNSRLVYPALILEIGDFTEDQELGITSTTLYRMPVTLHYLVKPGGTNGKQPGVYDTLFTIKAAFDSPTAAFTTFVTREQGRILTDYDAPVNVLYGQSQVQILAGCIKWDPGWTVSLY